MDDFGLVPMGLTDLALSCGGVRYTRSDTCNSPTAKNVETMV